jgi:hypothetical protein
MEASYPISLISHGIGLNITCQSYADVLAFAFVGCRDTLPHLQNVAVYTADALAELEASLAKPRAARPARKKSPAKKARSRKATGTKAEKAEAQRPASSKPPARPRKARPAAKARRRGK